MVGFDLSRSVANSERNPQRHFKRVLKVTSKETSEEKATRVTKALTVEKPAPHLVPRGVFQEVATGTCQAILNSRDSKLAGTRSPS